MCIAAVAVLMAPLAACSRGPESVPTAGGAGHRGVGETPGREATVTVVPEGRGVRAGGTVKVTAAGGALTSVTVADGDGHALTGTISSDGASWVSRRKTAPGTSYTVTTTTVSGGGRKGAGTSVFTTAGADKINKVDWRPGTNTSVGVAQPVSLVFDHPVTDRAEVEKQLKITTSGRTEGSWAWMKDWSGRDRVDWRPKEYWKPGTKVTLHAELNGTDSGDGGWFVRDYTTTFSIGESRTAVVDLDRKLLTLKRDGRTVRTIPVSGGTPGGDKRSWRGTAVLMAKEGTINMNSETVGLGDSYDKMVDHSMRLTWSGMYAHAAPWNHRWFGKANMSSGCIGMSDADAAWFYGQVRPGDPFEITGRDTKGTVAPGNGFGDWNVPWERWQKMSALR
ncbi:Ig-like domain-containing protein [Streptomyces sp. NBC_01341]|uniref:L,D-transpeptidase n=1 Tax=Streptomyces sp. NBC_01341 TaxID=2903831 RepID=UPI002E139EB4|nr:Ig-like domain-containing protein [Streptomyces sp. NBC_01341]